MTEAILLVLGVFFFLVLPLITFLALNKAKRATRSLVELRRSLTALKDQIGDLRNELDSVRSQIGLAAVDHQEDKEPAEAVKPAEIQAAEEITKDQVAPHLEVDAEPQPPPPPQQSPIGAFLELPSNLEEALTSRWLVWVGAIAIALAATFLVKHAIDEGWLGPTARVTLGLVLGVALTCFGEWLRRKPFQRAIASVRPNHVPPALTSAGLFAAFASIYAAYALYGLIPPLIAFTGLAAIALVAIALSILQGWVVALLGLLAAFVTPALVVTPQPSPFALFGYLLIIQVACLLVTRWGGWWWLSYPTLVGAALWPLAWLNLNWSAEDALPVGGYLILTFGAFFYLRAAEVAEWPMGWIKPIGKFHITDVLPWAAALTIAGLVFLLVHKAEYGTVAIAALAVFVVLCLLAGRRETDFEYIGVLAAILVLLTMVTWDLAEPSVPPDTGYQFEGQERLLYPAKPLVPRTLQAFARIEVLFAVIFGAGGFIALWGARRPALWAGISSAVPLLLLVIAYWRIADWVVDIRWTIVAVGFAFANLFCAARTEHYRSKEGLSVPLSFYAAAVVAFISLGAAMTMRQAWLTVALSLQLPALAWIERRVPEGAIRLIAAIVGGVVLVRLIANYNILDYALSEHLPLNWIIYGYGVPAIMFFVSAKMFRIRAADHLVTLLEAGALVFFVLLISLQIRVLISGSLDNPTYNLLEQSLQTLSWLSIGFALALNYGKRPNAVSFYGSRVLLLLATSQIVFLQLLYSNPVLTQESVGSFPIVNNLFLAYAAPAIFMFGFATILRSEETKSLAQLAGILGFVLVFTYLTLEVRRAFQGPVLSLSHRSDAESYAYSVAWLLYAGLLLALGILQKRSVLRYASLGVLLITVVKVFLFDMGDLKGLYRVASFLGLGLSLVGIGYLYQKYVLQKPTADGMVRNKNC